MPATKTKTSRDRTIPVSTRLQAVLEMRRTDPVGDDLPPEAYVFGTATGERVLSFKRAWDTARLKAHGQKPTYVKGDNLSPESRATLREIDLHFHDLRREAGSRWVDRGMPLHHVEASLGHTNLSQTSTYIKGTKDGRHESMRQYDE